jgi:hypothetical protein
LLLLIPPVLVHIWICNFQRRTTPEFHHLTHRCIRHIVFLTVKFILEK